eukprot:6181560-Pleurochrysis_carterae.AAC.1
MLYTGNQLVRAPNNGKYCRTKQKAGATVCNSVSDKIRTTPATGLARVLFVTSIFAHLAFELNWSGSLTRMRRTARHNERDGVRRHAGVAHALA